MDAEAVLANVLCWGRPPAVNAERRFNFWRFWRVLIGRVGRVRGRGGCRCRSFFFFFFFFARR